MPIPAQFRRFYGYKWRTVTRPRILERCGGLCERCRRCPKRIEVAHLDQDRSNDADDNLAGLCHGCHRKWDYEHWARKAHETRAGRKDQARPLLRQIA